ncbi:MAG: hypothetical protein GY768_13290 [Planctomycetaceae bacterium]|nr:hypothetical protein [Planctomycetaceae bacterium]
MNLPAIEQPKNQKNISQDDPPCWYPAGMRENLMQQIASSEILELAFAWLYKRREHYSHHDDVWHVRYHWPTWKWKLQADLKAGRYRFSPLRRFHRDGDNWEIWSAADALVLKAIAIVLTQHLSPQLSKRCTHLAGHGGAKGAVRQLLRQIPQNKFVFRTDVKHYYASIRHEILQAQLSERIDDPALLDLLWQFMRRTVCDGGVYQQIQQGISLGCPLSPLMGALFLDLLDKRMEKLRLCYVRFMDDWVVLAPTRWKLRRAIRSINETLAELQVKQHPDKTFVGKIERGFTFLGYQINAAGLIEVAPPTKKRLIERMARLDEQDATDRIGQYVRRWWSWLISGFNERQINSLCGDDSTTYQYILPYLAKPR